MKHVLNKELISKLFGPTSKYTQRKKECISELRDCYEKYSGEYISASDFIQQLNEMGFKKNKKDEFKLRLKKNVREAYFSYHFINHICFCRNICFIL